MRDIITETVKGNPSVAAQTGLALAEKMLAAGGKNIMDELRRQTPNVVSAP
jgi:hypothetical protein